MTEAPLLNHTAVLRERLAQLAVEAGTFPTLVELLERPRRLLLDVEGGLLLGGDSFELPLEEPGAYLVVARAGDLLASDVALPNSTHLCFSGLKSMSISQSRPASRSASATSCSSGWRRTSAGTGPASWRATARTS